MGAFASLPNIQPFTLKYDSKYQPAMVCMHPNLSFFVSCCTHPFNTVRQKIFPVFKPNEYFWKHHWDGKQDKGKLYMNTIRNIMIKTHAEIWTVNEVYHGGKAGIVERANVRACLYEGNENAVST